MTLQLFKLDEHPNRIAASKIDSFVPDGVFFLDFTRPLEKIKKYGLKVVGVFAPVVHQREQEGGYVISVHMSEPLFEEVRALWKVRYPEASKPVAAEVDGFTIVSDFATQFPEDSQ